jgi:hypothetical protein
MTDTPESAGPETTVSGVSSAPGAGEAKPRRKLPLPALIGAGALVLGLIIGAAVGSSLSAPTAEDKADAVQQKEDLAAADEMIDEQRGKIFELTSHEKDLDDREAALVTRDAAVAAREAAVTTVEAAVAANTIPGDGTYIVGTDVQPGTYRSEGGSSCYWARLNATGDDIIDNNLASGPAVLTIQAGDGLIKVNNCAPFTKAG